MCTQLQQHRCNKRGAAAAHVQGKRGALVGGVLTQLDTAIAQLRTQREGRVRHAHALRVPNVTVDAIIANESLSA
jgi:hypothetical protein